MAFVNKQFEEDSQASDHASVSTTLHSASSTSDRIVIIGTGDLGRALVACLVRRGYRVIVASRNPNKNRLRIESVGGEIDSYENAIAKGGIVIVAIPYEGFTSLPVDLLRHKIVIDVSNKPLKYDGTDPSLAYKLQKTLSESKVVKAFNTISAYGLQNNLLQGCTEIPVCSDHDDAKLQVMALVRNLGFMAVDRGNLSSAAEIEEITLALFPEWRLAVKLFLITFLVLFIIDIFRNFLCPNFQQPHWSDYNTALLDNCNMTFALTAIILLSSCYLPGVLASFLQLRRGTKYSEFPKCLDNWLRSRKQIGLLALMSAALHVVTVILMLIAEGIKDHWTAYTAFTMGATTLCFLTILGITSLPSVAQSLTWREFSFVQRYLGWWALTCALSHLILIKWNNLISNRQRCVVLPDPPQVIIFLPLVTVLLKMVLLLPCVDSHLQKIRRGYERTSHGGNLA